MRYADAILADGPVSWWRLDESSGTTAADQMGANPGTYTGGFTLGQSGALTQSGDPDASVSLNGTTGYVSVPFAASLNPATFTYEAWIKPAALGSFHAIFSTRVGASPNMAGGWFYLNASDLLTLDVSTGTSDIVGFQVASGAVVGTWMHVAATWNPTTGPFQGWINGVSVASGSQVAAGYIANTSAVLGIGQDGAYNEFFFSGSIDEPAVYNYALSTAQVAAHYNAGVGLPGRSGSPTRMPLGA